jgi:hypothetical protein
MLCPSAVTTPTGSWPEEWAQNSPLSEKNGPAFMVGVLVDEQLDDQDLNNGFLDRLRLVFQWLRDSGAREVYRQAGLGPPDAPEVRGLGLQRTPILVLTTLAPGASQSVADRVAAWAANHAHTAGLRVVPVLPYFPDLYVQSAVFAHATQCAKDRVQQWNGQPEGQGTPVVAGLHEDMGLDDAGLRAKMRSQLSGAPSLRRRRAAGEYVVSYCDLLVVLRPDLVSPPPAPPPLTDVTVPALIDARRRGLTPGLLPVTSRLNWSDNGPVIQIHRPATAPGTLPPVCLTVLQAYTTRPAGVKLADHQNWKWQTAGHTQLRAVTDHLERLYHEPVPAGPWWQYRTRENLRKKEADEIRGELAKALPGGPKPPPAPDDRSSSDTGCLTKIGQRLLAGGCCLAACMQRWSQFPWIGKVPPPSARRSTTPTSPATDPLLLPGAPLPDQLRRLARWRRRISQWNGALDTRVKNLNRWYFRFALAAVVGLQVYDNWSILRPDTGASPPKAPWQIVGASSAVGLLLLGWFVHQQVRRRHLENRQNDTRALAEALRVQLYWTAAGTGKSVASTYLIRQRGEVSWIRSALCSLASPYDQWAREFARMPPDDQLELLQRVRRGWVEEQKGYFARTAQQFTARQDACERGGKVLIVAGVALLLGILAMNTAPERLSPATLPGTLALFALTAAGLWGTTEIARCLSLLLGPCGPATLGRYARAWWAGKRHGSYCGNAPPSGPNHHAPGFGNADLPPLPLRQRLKEGKIRLDRDRESRRPPWLNVKDRPLLAPLLPMPLRGLFGHLLLGLIVATLTATACHWIAHPEEIPVPDATPWLAAHIPPGTLPDTTNLLAISRSLLLSIGTLCFAWSQLRFFAENIRRYESSAALFASADQRLEELLTTLKSQNHGTPVPRQATLADIQGLLCDLGLEALAENAEWLMMHRARPHQPVQSTA